MDIRYGPSSASAAAEFAGVVIVAKPVTGTGTVAVAVGRRAVYRRIESISAPRRSSQPESGWMPSLASIIGIFVGTVLVGPGSAASSFRGKNKEKLLDPGVEAGVVVDSSVTIV